MAYCFNEGFSKILIIHDGVTSSTSSQGVPLVQESCVFIMRAFTEYAIIHGLNWSCNVFSVVDPIQTWVMKECLAALLSPITKIVNISLSLRFFS